ncbi:MAG: hypothetical protein HY321_06810 [Armatimonadetes bacterium]|nr:hypothetical protein [Armatimonadota bacterium]
MGTNRLSRRDAMLAKIHGRRVERIPFATYNFHPFGSHAKDPSYAALLELVDAKAGMFIKHGVRRVGTDAATRERRVEQTRAETRTTTLWHTPKGDLRSVFVVPRGQPGYTVEHFIKTNADVERVLSVPHATPDFDAADTRRFLETLGDRGVVAVTHPDPMAVACSLFDFEEFVVRCITDSARIQALIDYLAAGIYAEVERMAVVCEGLPIIFHTSGPELATPPMLSPAVFARLVTPCQKRINEILHARGHRSCIHCHGRVRLVLDEMLETGTDALEPIEPPRQGDITLAELLERVDGRLCLIGHIQDQDFYLAAPGEMRRRVAEIAAVVSPASRYIMTPTCTPFQHPASRQYVAAYSEWIEAAAELLP